MMYRIFVIILFFLALLSGIIYFSPKKSYLIVNDKNISLIIADSKAERIHGLSDIQSLPQDSAMLFIFDTPDKYGIWMKDMKFSIDIIWLDEKKEIIYIEKDVSPNTYPKVFFPPEKSLYVVEANAGFSDKNQLIVGKILDINKK